MRKMNEVVAKFFVLEWVLPQSWLLSTPLVGMSQSCIGRHHDIGFTIIKTTQHWSLDIITTHSRFEAFHKSSAAFDVLVPMHVSLAFYYLSLSDGR